MRTWQEWHREGTDMGPVDWDAPEIAEKLADTFFKTSLADLKELEQHPERFMVGAHGCVREVISFRMYDGWPYWMPRPAFLTKGPLGPEWQWLDASAFIRRKLPSIMDGSI